MLQKEIKSIKNNQNEVIVYFRNSSTITVVPASENGRGYRSNCTIREEFRQIDKKIEDSVLSPFLIARQVPYSTDPYYVDIPDHEPNSVMNIYISSSWLDDGHWMWNIVDKAYDEMLNGKDSCLLAFDESVTIKHKIKLMDTLVSEKKKQDPLTWQIEFLNLKIKENTSAFYTYKMLRDNQNLKKPFYPRTTIDFLSRKRNPYAIPKQEGEIRVISCDLAFIENKKNDNSVFTCARLIPETESDDSRKEIRNGYRIIVSYIESMQGGDIDRQSVRIRELHEDWSNDILCLDTRNAGSNAVYKGNFIYY